jgi:hypothetical protein
MEEPSLEVKMPEADLKAVKFSLMTSSDMVIFHTGCNFNLMSLEIIIRSYFLVISGKVK